jgi:hypothetical protein
LSGIFLPGKIREVEDFMFSQFNPKTCFSMQKSTRDKLVKTLARGFYPFISSSSTTDLYQLRNDITCYLSGKHHKKDGKNLIHQAFAMHTGGNS